METKTRKIHVQELRLGMYVSALDRPWLGTPFLFQGFPIQSEEELAQLRACCEYVYVDEVQHTPPPTRTPVAGMAARAPVPRERDLSTSNLSWRRDTPPDPTQHDFRVRVRRVAQTRTGFLDLKNGPRIDRRYEFHKIRIPAAEPPHDRAPQDPARFLEEVEVARKIYRRAHHDIHRILNDARLGHSLDLVSAKSLVNDMAGSIVADESALVWFTQLKNRDEYTSLHSINVCVIALLFGHHLGLSLDELRELGTGALLHDVGKMRVPIDILNKPGPPTMEEQVELRRHPEHGVAILGGREDIPESAIDIVYSHHERIDGSGYPRGLPGDRISVFSMIVSIADVYDAVTSDRVYHHGITPHEALNLMYEEGPRSFHQDLLEEFIQCLGIYPIGSLVELTSGEVGVVMTVNRSHHLKPIVALVLGPDKQPYPLHKLINLDLMQRAGHPVAVRRILEAGAYGLHVGEILRKHAG